MLRKLTIFPTTPHSNGKVNELGITNTTITIGISSMFLHLLHLFG